jgi:hypothetical protein
LPNRFCDERECKHNEDLKCVDDSYLVDRHCVTYRKKPKEEDINQLMQAPFKANCHKTGTKWRSKNVNVVK